MCSPRGLAGLARRGGGQDRLHRRRSRKARRRRREDHSRSPRNRAGGHRRHARFRRDSHQHRRHDQPRGGRRPRHGHALRRRRGRRPSSTRPRSPREDRRQDASGPNDFISLDGGTGEVMDGSVPTGRSDSSPARSRTHHEMGRQIPHAEGPHQRRHAHRCAASPANSAPKASACAAPSTCFSIPQRIHHMREMILASTIEAPQGRAGEAAAVSAGGFHRHLQGDERLAGHDSPAGSAAA